MDIPAHVAPARPPRRIGPIVAGSLMAGFVAALVLVLGPFAGAPENVISGTMLLAFAGGWALLAVLSLPGPSNPQQWAAAPAGLMALFPFQQKHRMADRRTLKLLK